MKRIFQTMLVLLCSYGMTEAQDKTYRLQAKLVVDQTFDLGKIKNGQSPGATYPGEAKLDYRLSAPLPSLAFYRKNLGLELITHDLSSEKVSIPFQIRDNQGNITQHKVLENRTRTVEYSLEFNYRFRGKNWKRLDLFLAAGLRHRNFKSVRPEIVLYNGTEAFPLRHGRHNSLGVHISPKAQYRLYKGLFAEVALPYTVYEYTRIDSFYEFMENTATNYSTTVKDEFWRKNRVTVRLGVGYAF